MTTSRALLLVGLLVGAAAVAPGCGANVPANPTWAEDVHPIMVARCIRCHHSPAAGDFDVTIAAGNFDFQNFADIDGGDLNLLTGEGADQAQMGLMPPPPAARLADWQIETLRNWSKNPQ
jgi:hypothetical protein